MYNEYIKHESNLSVCNNAIETFVDEGSNKSDNLLIKFNNVYISVIGRYMEILLKNNEKVESLIVNLKFIDTDKESIITILISDIVNNHFVASLETEGVIFLNNNEKTKLKAQIQMIRNQVKCIERIQGRQGFFEYKGQQYWALGDRVLQSAETEKNNSFTIDSNSPKLKKFVLGHCFESLTLVDIDDKIGPMCMLYLGMSVWGNIIVKNTLNIHKYTLYILGVTASVKTSIARLVTDIYVDSPAFSLTSSYAGLQTAISKYGTTPLLLDDYNKSECKTIEREKCYKAVEFIQNLSDGTAIEKSFAGKSYKFNVDSGLIVTSEIELKNPSTINRCLLVDMKQCIVDEKALSEVQECNRKYGSFTELVIEMVQFTLDHYNELVAEIPKDLSIVLEEVKGFDKYRYMSSYRRVIGSHRASMITIILWNEFLKNNNVGEKSGHICKKMYNALIEVTKETLESLVENNLQDEILKCLYDVVNSSKSKYAEKVSDYTENEKEYFGIKQGNKIYVLGEELKFAISKKMGKDISKKLISNILFGNGLITRSQDGRHCIQINGDKRRYYCINIKKLNKIYQHDNDAIKFFNGSLLND